MEGEAESWEALMRRTLERIARPGVLEEKHVRDSSGLELFQGMLDGRVPPPPITETAGFILTTAERGRITFHGMPTREFYNPLGSVHGGWITTLLDSCMACAVHSTLPAGQTYTTVELKVNFVRRITVATGAVQAEGRLIYSGRQIATAEGSLTDRDGKLLAHGTTTCMLFPT